MTTTSIHTWFNQEMEVTHNHDVILRLHDPQDDTLKFPELKCDLSQFLAGIAFMFEGRLTADEFIRYFHRDPHSNMYCHNCEHNMLGFDYCASLDCIRRNQL